MITHVPDEPLSEMGLLYRAIPIVEAFGGRLPLRSELRELTREMGVEFATAVFHRAVLTSELYGPFARDTRAFDLSDRALIARLAAGFEVTIVASQLYPCCGRAWGDHVEEWRAWARDLGFTTDVIATRPRASVAANARLISDHLSETRHPHRILVTYGQGTSEFRFLLAKKLRRDPEVVRHGERELNTVRAWISVCGSFGGALSSDRLLKGFFNRRMNRLEMRLRGRNPLTLEETSTESPLWKGSLSVPRQMLVASLVGLPLLSQIPAGLITSYKELARREPNDGAVAALDAVAHPGLVVPVPGLSQRAESHVLEPIFRRLLAMTALTMRQSLAAAAGAGAPGRSGHSPKTQD